MSDTILNPGDDADRREYVPVDDHPLRWSQATNERFFVWTAETPSVARALRAIASLLDNDPDLMVLTVVNVPGEPVDPWSSIVQVTFSRCPAHGDRNRS